ncbi:MAG: hypothetical protein ACM3O3_03820 [Syntrophothermus sp.]|nr:hypothetical protein [Ignavibacteriaceae bacterium]
MNTNRYIVKVEGKWGNISIGSAKVKDLYNSQDEAFKASSSVCIPINLLKKKPNSKIENVYDIHLFE